jgi:hypothetical protein
MIEKRYTHTCLTCKNEFKTDNKKRVRCSVACEQIERDKRTRVIRICSVCEQGYSSYNQAQRYCDVCKKDQAKTQRARRYGLTLVQLSGIIAAQGGKCALCDKPAVCVDHCHTALKVRGMLCVACNTSLNRVEVPGWVERAMEYLRHDGKCDI